MGIKVTQVDVKGYRSIRQLSTRLGTGTNSFVGANNVGKSNLMRAIALGFGEDIDGFDIQRDAPAFQRWGRPTVTLWFRLENPDRQEKRLLQHVGAVEEKVRPGKPHYADDLVIGLRVKYSKSGREEYLVTKGAGDRHLPEEEQTKVISLLRKNVRFVLVRSGEDLAGFLQGRFTEVLHGVLAEADSNAMTQARDLRSQYQAELVSTLLQPLADRVLEELGDIAPEISGIELVAAVPDVEETIRSAAIRLTDTAATSLAEKGTGIRGGLLVAMLRYLAEASKRSLVLAVEEPESFLHPTAQQAIRADLEGLAERGDVTLLITTHSPFVVSAAEPAQVFMVRKDAEGATSCAPGDGQPLMASVVRELFDNSMAAGTISEALAIDIPESCSAIVVVEGLTDVAYLTRAAELHGLEACLDQVYFDAAGGAVEAALRTLVWRGRSGLPVVTLLDHDEMGRQARSILTKQSVPKKHVITYRVGREIDDAEAEHLFEDVFMERFFKRHGEVALKSKVHHKDGWAFDLQPAYKQAFSEFVENNARAPDTQRFLPVLEQLLSLAGVTLPATNPAPTAP